VKKTEEDGSGGNLIKIMTIECGDDAKYNPVWAGITHILSGLGTVIVLLGLALSVKMCNSDTETLSRAWHGQLEAHQNVDDDD